jgi:hypothetical protein
MTTKKGSVTNYTLRLVDFNSPESEGKIYGSQFPVIFETQKKKLLEDYMRAFFPHHKLLPVGSPELQEFFSHKKPNGFPSKRFLDLRITPLNSLTYIENFSVDL